MQRHPREGACEEIPLPRQSCDALDGASIRGGSDMTDASGDVRGKARVVRANRAQLSWALVDPEGWLPAEHVARLVWSFVAALYDKVEPREGEPGRPASDAAVKLAL